MNPLRVLSLLSKSEASVANQIKQFLKEEKFRGWRLLYQIHPSAAINPRWLDDKPAEYKDALFTGLILYSIIEGDKKSHLRIAIIDGSRPKAELVVAILEEFKVPTFCGDISSDFTPLRNFLAKAIVMPRYSESKRITNDEEKWLLTNTDLALGRSLPENINKYFPPDLVNSLEQDCTKRKKQFRFFQEVALSAFIELNPLHPDEISIDWGYAAASSLDLLVTGDAPEFLPLLGIEFDGPTHKEDRGRAKDAKKDSIMHYAGIPLLRVLFHDGPPSKYQNIIDFAKVRDSKDKEEILQGIIRNCINALYEKKITQPESYNEYWDKVIKYVESAKSERQKINGSLPLEKSEVAGFLQEAMECFQNDRDLIDSIWWEDDYALEYIRRLDINPFAISTIMNSGAVFENYNYHFDVDGACYCTVIVKLNGRDITFQTPAVRFKGAGFSDGYFSGVVKHELIKWLNNSIGKWIANNSQSSRSVDS